MNTQKENLLVGSRVLLCKIHRIFFDHGFKDMEIEWAIFTGSAGPSMTDLEKLGEISYSEFQYFPQPTVDGHAGVIQIMRHPSKENRAVLIFQGRKHFYECENIQEVVFFARLAVSMWIKNIIFTNAAGALEANDAGKIMVINDTGKSDLMNPLLGQGGDMSLFKNSRFLSTTQLLDLKFIDLATDILHKEFRDDSALSGPYHANTGPDYESRIEVERLRKQEFRAVGMSTVPDLLAAKSMDKRVRLAAFSMLTNACIGWEEESEDEPNHEDVMKVSKERDDVFSKFITRFLVEA